MSSILTNTGAMVALQSLSMTNKSLNDVQGQISTGKKVATAKDNASIWAIAQTMTSDADSFKGISDSLNSASAAVGVARNAAETVTSLLRQVKDKIVAAQSPTADAAKLQTDITELRNQVSSVVASAQFNGLNMLDGTNASVDVLASLNRNGTGTVTTSNITVDGVNFNFDTATAPTGVFAVTNGTASANGTTFGGALDAAGTEVLALTATNLTATGGDKISVTVGGKTATYTVTADDMDTANGNVPAETIGVRLRDAIDALGIAGLDIVFDSTTGITLTNNGTEEISISGEVTAAGTGDLNTLAGIDVTTGAAQALTDIEALITTAIDAAAAFGSSQKRIDIQTDFVNALTDSFKTGIGALVDANMEEAAARLQALQVQQQLGVQSLSIANQAPQSVLSLFR